MKASKQNFLIDILAFIFFLFLTSTGIIVHYLLPAGSGSTRTIWGLGRHDWGDIHFYFAVGFLLILALHIFKHWKWIWSLVKGRPHSKPSQRGILGLVGLIAILTIAALPLISPVETNASNNNHGAGHGKHMETTKSIRGSMTLADVEKSTGVPAGYILQELELPANTSIDKKLKDLKTAYGFEMKQVHKLVENYRVAK